MSRHDQWGVAEGWWTTDGHWHPVEDHTVDALRAAQRISNPGSTSIADSYGTGKPDRMSKDGPPPDPPLWFARAGERHPLNSPGTVQLDDGTSLECVAELPPDLPLGAHRLHPADGGPTTELFVVPRCSPRPRRGWGWSAQLYASRSRHSWGLGDLADLGDLARWTAEGGGSLLAHSPLGAPLPTDHQQPSPYYASTRRFWSPLYLRIEDVRGAELVGEPLDVAVAAGRALNGDDRLDRDRVWALKRAALESIWAQIGATERVRGDLARAGDDAELTRFAVFCALAEHHGSGWSAWPDEYRHPDRDAVAAFAEEHAGRVAFHRWVQVEVDEQLRRAAAAGAGLMADLPVGFDPSGFDAWTDQDLLALDCSVGAPPDDFSPTGQDWGLPPYVPWRLRSVAYRPWLDTLQRVLRHGAALRIDHVMGLFRLFWIPSGASALEGGYVHHRGTDLLDLAVMEATRAGATLVGEDLGTVEHEVREALTERDVFAYRIGWFADDPPQNWPATTLASLTTHDLPTVAGIWSGQDAADRASAGQAPDPAGDARLRSHLERLAAGSSHPPIGGSDAPEGDERETDERETDERETDERETDEREISLSAHAALARSGSDLALATLEDAIGVRSRPNLPGTVDEHPNWRRALPVPIEDLDAAGAAQVAAIMTDGRDR